jgi:hypothetical protein
MLAIDTLLQDSDWNQSISTFGQSNDSAEQDKETRHA